MRLDGPHSERVSRIDVPCGLGAAIWWVLEQFLATRTGARLRLSISNLRKIYLTSLFVSFSRS